MENELKNVAEKYGMDLDTVKKYLRPEDVKEQVIREKVVKLVADNAVAVAPASRYSSCATTRLAVVSFTSSPRNTIRSLSRREKIS